MNDGEIIGKVQSSMYTRLKNQGVVSPFEVLMDVGVLSKEKYEDWRFGRVPFLEAVCAVNLKKLSFIMHQIRVYAKKHDLKPSVSFYKRWGVRNPKGSKKPAIKLRFSKHGDPTVETWYATSFVDSKRIAELKDAKKMELDAVSESKGTEDVHSD